MFTLTYSFYLAPSAVWDFVHCAASEAAEAYFKSLTDEQYEEYCDSLQGYCTDFSYGDKEDLCYFVDAALVNPDWVTPDLFPVSLSVPLPYRPSRRPAR